MPPSVRAALLGSFAVGLFGISGCGATPQRTALAIERAGRVGPTVTVETECSEHLEVTGSPDPIDPTLYRVTIFGEPTVGRCRPTRRLQVPPGTTNLLDETTSQVVDLPPR